MNREQIIDFIQQTQTMIQQMGELQKNLNQGKGLKELLVSRGEDERVLEIAQELKKVSDVYDKSSQALLRKCKQPSIEACELLLEDIVNRLKLADEAQANWRTLLASHDVETQLNPDPAARAGREADITTMKKRFELTLELASQLVPSPGVVIL